MVHRKPNNSPTAPRVLQVASPSTETAVPATADDLTRLALAVASLVGTGALLADMQVVSLRALQVPARGSGGFSVQRTAPVPTGAAVTLLSAQAKVQPSPRKSTKKTLR